VKQPDLSRFREFFPMIQIKVDINKTTIMQHIKTTLHSNCCVEGKSDGLENVRRYDHLGCSRDEHGSWMRFDTLSYQGLSPTLITYFVIICKQSFFKNDDFCFFPYFTGFSTSLVAVAK